MCYSVYISTDSEEDLSRHNSALISFEKDFAYCEPEIMDLLLYKHPWYVGSKAGCSCTFRHLHSVELGFGEPVDWYVEEPDEIEATKNFYDVVASLISSGSKVDCIEIWAGTKKDQIKHLAVDLLSIPRDAFRFFENHHFVFSNKTLLSYHPMKPGEETGVIDLVSKVFTEFVAPQYSQEGVLEFLKYVRVDDLVERIKAGNFVLLAKSGRDIIAAVEVRENHHISLLFVEKSHQRKGIGKELLKKVIEISKAQKPDALGITVNSSPNSVAAYQKMGFITIGEEQVVNGIRFIPMELSLD